MNEDKKDSELEEESTTSKEDIIMERLVKYSQGCTVIMIVLVSILVFLIWFYFS